nr:MAG TPA: hypothetical protein [Caudoviricetes sp.]
MVRFSVDRPAVGGLNRPSVEGGGRGILRQIRPP